MVGTQECELVSLRLSLTHSSGDISYARGTALIWEQYFALVEPIAETIPYMVSIGTTMPSYRIALLTVVYRKPR